MLRAMFERLRKSKEKVDVSGINGTFYKYVAVRLQTAAQISQEHHEFDKVHVLGNARFK